MLTHLLRPTNVHETKWTPHVKRESDVELRHNDARHFVIIEKKLENTVNTFQRRHLRTILGIHWPKKITNIEQYTKTKTRPPHETSSRDTSQTSTR